ncbi:MAG: nucleoside-diphosphate sugar epimerase/dehydratase [Sedimenticolaceae bacterium]
MNIDIFAKRLTALSRLQKQIIMIIADALMLQIALWSAFSLRFGEWYLPNQSVVWLFVLAPIVALPIFIKFGLYRAIIRYIGFHALWAVIQSVTLYALVWAVVALLSKIEGVLRSITLINWMMAILLIGGSRMVARWWFADMFNSASAVGKSARSNVVIYGAGSAGMQLATGLSHSREFKPVAFIDDKVELHHHHIQSLRVYPFAQLGQMIETMKVHEVLLALPSASRSRRNEIIALLESYSVRVRTLPGMAEMAQGRVKIEDIREVTIEDMLERDLVAPNLELLHTNIKGKAVMVTGAGGSIGSELCRQIVKLKPAVLILFEQCEYALYSIDKELAWHNIGLEIIAILGSVQDSERLAQVVSAYGAQTIYHAAAYKHVPMVEKNPVEAIQNNIIGTWQAAEVARARGVETFVLISTDKAVRPTNTMGATKRFAELVLQGLAKKINSSDVGANYRTRFCMVRFGNVLGSSGSVVPLFHEQISRGGPVTVTDPNITRFFMTISEAAQLVIQAGAMGQGGDVFVLNMGEPVKILDLAKKMIHLSGFEVKDDDHPKGDVEIQFTGLRSGEKLYEELLIGDNVRPTDHPLIMCAEEDLLPWESIVGFLNELDAASKAHDQEKIRSLLIDAVAGFKPQCGIEDNLYKQRKDHRDSNMHLLIP